MSRATWYMDFVKLFLNGYVKDRKISMVQLAKDSYSQALAPHHSWVLQKMSNLSMGLLNSRETMESRIL